MRKVNMIIRYIFRILALVIYLGSVITLSKSVAWSQSYDLTGYWESNQGAIYQFRQVEDHLFWYVDFSPSVVNVFYGTIAGNTITGRWADLPAGTNRGQGTVALRIESNDRIVKISETGTYGGTFWQRGGRPSSTSTTASTGTEKPPLPPPSEQESPCGQFAGCFGMNWKRGGGGTFSFYEASPDRCEYDEVDAGDVNRHRGVMTLEPDPKNPPRLRFTMKDTWTKNNNLCTFTGLVFGDTVKECKILCDDNWSSDCANFKPQRNQGLCETYELKVGKGQRDLVSLYDTVLGLGSWWMVYGADRWDAIWTRRDSSDMFDGEWRRGGTVVRTVLQIERQADKFKATRLESSDGYRCIFEGQIKGTSVEGTQRCAAPNQDFNRPVPFKAVIHP